MEPHAGPALSLFARLVAGRASHLQPPPLLLEEASLDLELGRDGLVGARRLLGNGRGHLLTVERGEDGGDAPCSSSRSPPRLALPGRRMAGSSSAVHGDQSSNFCSAISSDPGPLASTYENAASPGSGRYDKSRPGSGARSCSTTGPAIRWPRQPGCLGHRLKEKNQREHQLSLASAPLQEPGPAHPCRDGPGRNRSRSQRAARRHRRAGGLRTGSGGCGLLAGTGPCCGR